MTLKNKRILITAGPTWVPIDSVRVISNIATGETGILLAQEARRQGAKVTLILGPGNHSCLDKSIRVLHFKFFDELKFFFLQELKSKKYNVLIHTAAVADYRLKKNFKRKISSGLKRLDLSLVPTHKLVDLIKSQAPSLFAVAFKFQPDATKERLVRQAQGLRDRTDVNLVLANTINRNRYRAYIVGKDRIFGPLASKSKMAQVLIKKIGKSLERT